MNKIRYFLAVWLINFANLVKPEPKWWFLGDPHGLHTCEYAKQLVDLRQRIGLVESQPDSEWKPPAPTARGVVDYILERPIEWVDWKGMPIDLRRAWGQKAKTALENDALCSIIGKSALVHATESNGEIVKRCIEAVARRSHNHDETNGIRMTINGMELVRELLEEMLWTEDRDSQDDPNAPI